MMKKIAFFLLTSLLLISCHKENGITFQGTITGANGVFITISRESAGEILFTDSVQIVDNKFSMMLSTDQPAPDFYRISLRGQNELVTLAAAGETLQITADAASLARTYQVEGSEEAARMALLDNRLALFADSMEYLVTLYGQCAYEDSVRGQIEAAYQQIKDNHAQFLRAFIQNNPQSFSGLAAFYQRYNQCVFLPEQENLALLQQLYESLSKQYPAHDNVKWLQQRLDTEANRSGIRE